MMTEVIFPGGGNGALEGVATGRRLPFYLAAEEYLARRPAGDGLFFLWQVGPTVIFGRNQDPSAELDMEWCRSAGVEYYRRKSGGGCVYADRGNIMISCIYPGSGVKENFAKFSASVCGALQSLGLPAEVSGRNDILIGGRKVSGSAFFALPSSSVVHCTMLYDIDSASMEAALSPSGLKLGSKGVRSVSARVCTLKEFMPDLKPESLAYALRASLSSSGASGQLVLGEEDVAEIEKIEMSYLDKDFILGRHGGRADGGRIVSGEGYVEGCGFIKAELHVVNDKILNVSLSGDFFAMEYGQSQDVSESLSQLLAGRVPSRRAVADALEGVELGKMVRGLSAAAFVDILFRNC